MEEYIRAHIRLTTLKEINDFVSGLNSDGTTDKYVVETFDGTIRVNARSLQGMIYAATEHNEEMYLVNDTNNGTFPSCVDKYRV